MGKFTCPECGSHRFGSGGPAGGPYVRSCHGMIGTPEGGERYCRFSWPQSDDYLYGLAEAPPPSGTQEIQFFMTDAAHHIEGDLASVFTDLREFYDASEACLWLAAPHRLLGGRKPIEVIELGGADEVHAVIDQLQTGAFV